MFLIKSAQNFMRIIEPCAKSKLKVTIEFLGIGEMYYHMIHTNSIVWSIISSYSINKDCGFYIVIEIKRLYIVCARKTLHAAPIFNPF